MASPPSINGIARRPTVTVRHPTAPSAVSMKGQFAEDAALRKKHEHGIQIIDQDKEFK